MDCGQGDCHGKHGWRLEAAKTASINKSTLGMCWQAATCAQTASADYTRLR